jgi:hypothetical protein
MRIFICLFIYCTISLLFKEMQEICLLRRNYVTICLIQIRDVTCINTKYYIPVDVPYYNSMLPELNPKIIGVPRYFVSAVHKIIAINAV